MLGSISLLNSTYLILVCLKSKVSSMLIYFNISKSLKIELTNIAEFRQLKCSISTVLLNYFQPLNSFIIKFAVHTLNIFTKNIFTERNAIIPCGIIKDNFAIK